MPLIKNQQLITEAWTELDDEQSLPSSGDVIVSFTRWQAEQEQLAAYAGKVAVILDNTLDVEDHAPLLQAVPLICLVFPAYTDGRAYTQARQLRQFCDYQGEIRATGDVLIDQLPLMQRCGIDSFELRDDQDVDFALTVFNDITVQYQANHTPCNSV